MFKTTTPLQRLRQSYAMEALPDAIDTGATGESGQPITKPIAQATVDEVSFALQSLGDQADAVLRRVSALRQLHDRARRAGAIGADAAVEAALRHEEGRR